MQTARKILKNILIRVLYYSGLPVIFREIIQKNKVTILVLHRPQADIAASILNGFRVITILSVLINTWQLAQTKLGHRLPPKSLIITLDDGHIENYNLLPRRNSIISPLTIFLCSGIVNTNRHYWFRFSGLPSTSESLKRISDQDRLRVLYQVGYYPEKEFAYPRH